MAHRGMRIENRAIGQAMTFVATRVETGGDLLRVEAEMQPGARMPSHRHMEQEERFEVLEGEASFWLGAEKLRRGSGESLVVPVGRPHRFKNESSGIVRIRAELRPALRTEELFETLFALGRAGKTHGKIGAPGPLATALLVDRFEREFFYPAAMPPGLVRAAAKPLAALARRLGAVRALEAA